MLEHWNERYKNEEYAYGVEPNAYLKEQLHSIPPGKILFPAEGEGRNAVYAAELGWDVWAFDQSIEGKHKADKLAMSKNVTIKYQVGEFSELNFEENFFDAIALIYAHFPSNLKSKYNQKLAKYLKVNGVLIFEAFSKTHLEFNLKNPKVGGPKDKEMLYSLDEIKNDFNNFNTTELIETNTNLSEGLYHIGEGSVIRFRGTKSESINNS
ncbi:MAG: methyltransferase domain-containing protein [Bacteroidia bacterium]